MGKTSYNKQQWAKTGFEDFKVPVMMDVPNTEIQNRAQIIDRSKSLSAQMGVERMPTSNIIPLTKEFGPNGEMVYELSNKDERIRFYGDWTNASGATAGSRPYGEDEAMLEVTFYGTGLNIGMILFSAVIDVRRTVDGGAESANIIPTSPDSAINNRQYNPNQIIPVISGLSLGQHTVQLRNATSTSVDFNLNQIEILNESTSVSIAEGSAFSGMKKETLSALASSAYDAGVVGARGARIVKYIKDGVVSQAVQEVGSQLNLSAADHSDEEIIRKIRWREFGANRSDDFSTLSTSNSDRAFTLDDGTTNLVVDSGRILNDPATGNTDAFLINQTGSFFTLTFVGTGLDIINNRNNTSSTPTYNVDFDGINIVTGINGDTLNNGGSTAPTTMPIVSGLPYGTHTVRFTITAGSLELTFDDFIIYGPKKPSIPEGAIEICDYNVLADFVANTVTGLETISTGVLRKFCTREFAYIDSASDWGIQLGILLYIGGHTAYANTATCHYEFTFFGTGFDMRWYGTTSNTANAAIDLKAGSGSFQALTTTNFPSISGNNSTIGTGISFNDSTGSLDMSGTSTQEGVGFACSNLPLGVYTLKMTPPGAEYIRAEVMDIITPIHMNNTIRGSLAMDDMRDYQPIPKTVSGVDLGKAKAWLEWDDTNASIKSSFNISAIVETGVGSIWMYFEKPFKNSNYTISGSANNSRVISTHSSYKFPQSVRMFMRLISTGAATAGNMNSFIFFGELENEGEE